MAAPLLKSDLFAPSAAESLSQIVLRLADPSVNDEIVSPVRAMQSRLEKQWRQEQRVRKANVVAAGLLLGATAFWMPVALHMVRSIAPH